MEDEIENRLTEKSQSAQQKTTTSGKNNIKERLNLHVKRRLQQDVSTAEFSSISNNNNNNDNKINKNNNETVKGRKQHIKRTEKSNTQTGDNAVRKTKRTKMKEAISCASSAGKRGGLSGAVDDKLTHTVVAPTGAGGVSSGSEFSTKVSTTGGDDDGSRDGSSNCQDSERPNSLREKEKCPDLLNMVLNAKKRALFRDPEVVKFLQNVLDVLKN